MTFLDGNLRHMVYIEMKMTDSNTKMKETGISARDLEMLKKEMIVDEIIAAKRGFYATPYGVSCSRFGISQRKFERWRDSVAQWRTKNLHLPKLETPPGSNQDGVFTSPLQAVDHATSDSLPASRPCH